MEANAILLEGLTKIYSALGTQSEKIALNAVNLAVPKGSIFGLLGPNGAGKSTLINILAGTVVKTSGKASIMGIDIDQDARLAKRHIGVVPQELQLDTFFPVREALEFYAGYYSIRPEARKTDEILEALGLVDKANATSKQLSGGMKRRFLVAKAMVHSPDVLILDEPTAGVDIELRDQLWRYVEELQKRGTTIILTTHYLAEAQQLCDQIAFINHGRIIKQDSKHNLLRNLGSRQIDLAVDAECALPKLENIKCKTLSGDDKYKIRISFNENDYTVGEVMGLLYQNNILIKDLRITEPDLETVFKEVIKNSAT